ncbi:hypothetical protein Bca52824_022836 [Brassica carinata]|uniref:Uncharacterized protein n=1 Tax=Brassica carinata TaxID=52824 RepID=A0A8X7VH17_BRACI|nr:hypothetical protein Bca52824_022836 [Brassica carinata]
MTILWEEMVFLTNSASGDDETIEMDETSVKSNIAIEKDLIIVIAPFLLLLLRLTRFAEDGSLSLTEEVAGFLSGSREFKVKGNEVKEKGDKEAELGKEAGLAKESES